MRQVLERTEQRTSLEVVVTPKQDDEIYLPVQEPDSGELFLLEANRFPIRHQPFERR